MPSRILAVPFFLLALLAAYFTWQVDIDYAAYIIPNVVVLGILFSLSPQIDWWWYRRHPPRLDAPMVQMLTTHHRFYQQLSPDEKLRFEQRIGLFLLNKEFKAQAAEELPEDLKIIVAANAIHLTFHLDDFLLPAFETVVIYPQAFPSPQYPEHFHHSEIFPEDGVVLFSAAQLVASFTDPLRYYNVALHEWAQVLKLEHPEWPWPVWPDEDAVWASLTEASGFTREFILQSINRPDVELLGAVIVHVLLYPAQLLAKDAALYHQIARILLPKS
ncbi:MAG: zinc-dependent peptidase [Lewinellaceae bacterium]|nr:zinc-dependent peptidase [Lewinellaceae bacterium]